MGNGVKITGDVEMFAISTTEQEGNNCPPGRGFRYPMQQRYQYPSPPKTTGVSPKPTQWGTYTPQFNGVHLSPVCSLDMSQQLARIAELLERLIELMEQK